MNVFIEKDIPVRMKDGIVLSTDVYRPVEDGPYPTLLFRTPYDKDRATILGEPDVLKFVQAGYAVVIQDCRGRFKSEGDFNPFHNEDKDGAETIGWAAAQPWSTGKVGTFGASYQGATQWRLAAEKPEALKAMVPVVTWSETYEGQQYNGGAFQLGASLGWSLASYQEQTARLAKQGDPKAQQILTKIQSGEAGSPNFQALCETLPLTNMSMLEGITPWYFDWLAHPVYDDFWRNTSTNETYEQITVPALHIGGWYDIFLGGTIANYLGMKEKGGSETARKHQRLLIGPWSHMVNTGIFPEREYGMAASMLGIDNTGMQIRWFDYWLKGVENRAENDKPVKIFVMGIDRWREEESWPLPDTKYIPYYLHSGGKANTASGDGTLSITRADSEREDVYLYNPHNPVPTRGGGILLMTGNSSGPVDQRSVESREDVLCYTTPPLERPVEVTGPVKLVLYVSSSALDTDFTGKLVDVHPNGRAEILTDGILRARYRNSVTAPERMEPGKIYGLHIDLVATSNVFKAGHRIQLEVSSSNFPRFNRNSNTGGNIAEEGTECYQTAVNRVYHGGEHTSHLLLPIIDRD